LQTYCDVNTGADADDSTASGNRTPEIFVGLLTVVLLPDGDGDRPLPQADRHT
jgi:hypothetical protein